MAHVGSELYLRRTSSTSPTTPEGGHPDGSGGPLRGGGGGVRFLSDRLSNVDTVSDVSSRNRSVTSVLGNTLRSPTRRDSDHHSLVHVPDEDTTSYGNTTPLVLGRPREATAKDGDPLIDKHSHGYSVDHELSTSDLDSELQTADGTHSHNASEATGHTSTSRASSVELRNSTPVYRCIRKVPFPVWVALTMLIPVGFLIGVEGSVVAETTATLNYVRDHDPMLSASTHCQTSLMYESGASTLVLSNNNTHHWEHLAHSFETSDDYCTEFHDEVQASHDKALLHFAADWRERQQELAVVRFRVTSGNITTRKQRSIYNEIIEEIDRSRSIVAVSPHTEGAGPVLFELKFVEATSHQLSVCRAVGAEIMTLHVDRLPTELYAEMYHCFKQFNYFAKQLRTLTPGGLSQFDTDPVKLQAEHMMETLMKNPLGPHNWTVDEWFDVFSGSLAEDIHLDIDGKAKKKQSKSLAVMITALVSTVLAAAFVMWLQFDTMRRIDRAFQDSRAMQRAISKFVPRAFLKLTGCTSILQVTVGGQTQVAVSMLFSDIRNFTRHSSGMGPEPLFLWLEGYLKRMTTITDVNSGFVDKFIGDAVFSVFVSSKDAIRAGIDMQKSTEQLNIDMKCNGGVNMLQIGVGIHHGVAAAGFLGDDNRVTATLVSSEVNLASRLEGLTKHYGSKILISDSAAAQVAPDYFRMRCIGQAQVVGADVPIGIVEVYNTDDVELQQYKGETADTWNEAVKLRTDGNVDGSLELFRSCLETAKEQGVFDRACEIKIGNPEAVDVWDEK